MNEHEQAIILKIIQVSSLSIPKNDLTHWKQKVDVAMCRKGVKLKWQNVILLSFGVLELLGKNLQDNRESLANPPNYILIFH